MTAVYKTIQLDYSAAQMYALVEDIESYPAFLPWCDSVKVQRDAVNQTVLAEMHMNVMGIRQTFTTRNQNTPSSSIRIQLGKGVFHELAGEWTFTPIDGSHCTVTLSMRYVFANSLLGKMLEPFFNAMTIDLVAAFQRRAKAVYG
ncbi:MAG: type II toxin-antitoxin system RatA family toxin [Oxalobacter sp.]